MCDFAPFNDLGDGNNNNNGIANNALVSLLVDAMNDLGLVVEGVDRIYEGLENVVVAQILSIDAIPGADRIRRIMVDAGEAEPIQIVCGAFNFDVGDKVPLAQVGAILPGDFAIARRKMRGVESFGMLCSEIELRLGSDRSGLMILPADSVVGTRLLDQLSLQPDVIFDLAIENNRPDANCVLGVARDLAARFNLAFSEPGVELNLPKFDLVGSGRGQASVECPDQCDRFVVAEFENINVQEVPDFVTRRLLAAGMRTVSPIVDITNYLMLELGQPTHPYDKDKLGGHTLSVRLATPGETIITLDGVERILGVADPRGREATDIVIVDGNNTPVGLAGIMGGGDSEITSQTSSVLLELAHFQPMTIARTSKRLGIRTEASARFERGVDPCIIEVTLSRFCAILGIFPINVIEFSTPEATTKRLINLRLEKVSQILGIEITPEKISSLIKPLGFITKSISDSILVVEVPTNRDDVEREIDLIEEVARLYGYRQIDKILPSSKVTGSLSSLQRFRRRIGSLAVGLGFYEAWSATLLAPGEQEAIGDPGPFIEVDNPLASEESVLRRSLMPGLLRALQFNLNRNESNIRLFEIGKVFSLFDDQIIETERVAFLLGSNGDGVEGAMKVFASMADMFSVNGVSILNSYEFDDSSDLVDSGLKSQSWQGLHPTRSAFLLSDGSVMGYIGELDPRVLSNLNLDIHWKVGYLELDLLKLFGSSSSAKQMQPISPFPPAQVDLAFQVPDEVKAWDIERVLALEVSDYIRSAKLFDVFRGGSLEPGTRSLAFAVTMVALDRTLSDADITKARQSCIDTIEKRFRAKLRS